MKAKFYLSGINNYYNDIYIENALVNINETTSLFSKLICDKELGFNEYIDIINRIYSVQINDNDLFKISDFILGGKVINAILATDVMGFITTKIEINNNFEYVTKENKLYVKVAFSHFDDIDLEHEYSILEIKKLIRDKKIVLLDFVTDDDCCEYEDGDLYSLSNVTSNNFTNLKYINEEYIPAIMSFLKGYFTKDRLEEDFANYIKDVEAKLDIVESYIMNVCSGYSFKLEKYNNIISECKKIRKRKISKDS